MYVEKALGVLNRQIEFVQVVDADQLLDFFNIVCAAGRIVDQALSQHLAIHDFGFNPRLSSDLTEIGVRRVGVDGMNVGVNAVADGIISSDFVSQAIIPRKRREPTAQCKAPDAEQIIGLSCESGRTPAGFIRSLKKRRCSKSSGLSGLCE